MTPEEMERMKVLCQQIECKRLTNTPGRSIRKSKPWLIGVSTCSEG